MHTTIQHTCQAVKRSSVEEAPLSTPREEADRAFSPYTPALLETSYDVTHQPHCSTTVPQRLCGWHHPLSAASLPRVVGACALRRQQ